ncbi:Bax inhibitor-1/YccA family protein [Mycoplasmatota bacterium WC44]
MRLMRHMRSSNPVFKSMSRNEVYSSGEAASYGGIVFKTLFLFLIALTSGFVVMNEIEFVATNLWIFYFAMFGAFFSVLLSRNPRRAKIFAPLYAAFEGVFLGVVVSMYNVIAPTIGFGIVETAVLITLSVFLVMLVLYGTGVVRVGPIFRRLVIGALFGLVTFTIITMLIGLFSPAFRGAFYTDNTILLISLISAGIASLMILLDLDNCTKLVQAGAPKDYEWSASLGLMVTIVWLFIEILRILLIFSTRRD